MIYRRLTPLLPVEDLEGVIRFYTDVLGFDLTSSRQQQGELEWCRLRCGKVEVMFFSPEADGDAPAELPGRKSVILYLFPSDLDVLYRDLKAKGCSVSPMRATFYGLDEFDLSDPTGYTLVFAQQSKNDYGERPE